MGVTAIIPARGGSKRIPRKNLTDLGGKPLLAWTIEAALDAVSVDRVIVSTEDAEIATVAREWGAEVLDRPARLATDDVPTRSVTGHAILAAGITEGVALLHPTSPFRNAGDIDRAAAWPWKTHPVVSVTNDELNGALYIADAATLLQGRGSFFQDGLVHPFPMPLPAGLDIDTPADLEYARSLLANAVAV